MIILSQTTDTVEVVLGGTITTNQLRCFSSWRDITTTTFAPDRTTLDTNNTTAVSIVGSPAASTQRVVDLLNVYNSDTVAQTVTVQFNANGTKRAFISVSLATGESLVYQEGAGWTHLTASGAVVTSLGTVTVPYGGTGITSYAVGDLLYANTTTSLAKLADVATGSVLISGGVGVAPSWSQTTGITGVGALTSGSIGSGFGSINVGANSITGGAGSFTTLTSTGNYTVSAGFKLTQNTNAFVSPEDNVRGAVLSGTGGAYLMAGGSVIAAATSTGLAVTGALKLGNAYVATPPSATGYVTLQDSTGTTYKVLVST